MPICRYAETHHAETHSYPQASTTTSDNHSNPRASTMIHGKPLRSTRPEHNHDLATEWRWGKKSTNHFGTETTHELFQHWTQPWIQLLPSLVSPFWHRDPHWNHQHYPSLITPWRKRGGKKGKRVEVCLGYSATDESKYYLTEKINKILLFWYSFELQCTAIFSCTV